ncbi:MAG TPA: TonB-dependent receptor [Steroidobacteraceae bacterium]|nr:TonB-dependent receptor [Steroidobacteraceae bacterium]
MKTHRTLIAVTLGGCALLTLTANAQTTTAHPDEGIGVLQEVVVTAQKRSETILSVPISITALSQESLEHQGIKDINDIARATPSLNIGANNGFGYSNVSIRGVASTTGAATTGIYIDDSPIEQRIDSLTPPLAPQLFDLNRVEVLRGPQGTLFGSGSEGGTIRFITPAPSLTESSVRSRTEFAYTDKGAPTYEAGLAGGAPLIDGQLGLRASAWYRDQGGYIDRVNRYTGRLLAPNSNGTITQAARFSLGWQPLDSLIITPTVMFQHVRQKDGNFFWEERPDFQSEAKIAAPDDDKWTLTSLTADYSLPALTIRSISSYLSRRNFQINDWSYIEPSQLQGGPVDVPGLPNWNAAIHANVDQAVFTQELRFTSVDSQSPFSWVGGLYFQHNRLHRVRNEFEDLDALTNAIFGAPAIAIFGSAPLPGPVGYAENTTQIEQESAAFGNVSYKLTDALKLTAGVRVARSRFSNSTFQDGPWNAGPSLAQGVQSETPITPKANLTYNLTPDNMLYATAAKGYRVGGGNASFAGNPICQIDFRSIGIADAPPTYKSDSVWSYEVGTKNRLFNGITEISASVFRVNWSNIQSLIFLPTCGNIYTDNFGAAVSQGGDIELQTRVVEGLTWHVSAGYTDAHYSETKVLGSVNVAVAGEPLPIPRVSGSTSLDYTHALFDTGRAGYLNLTYDYTGHYQLNPSGGVFGADPNTSNGSEVRSLSARSGVRFNDLDLSIFVNNVTNSRDTTLRYHETLASTVYRDQTLRPRTVGLTFTYGF